MKAFRILFHTLGASLSLLLSAMLAVLLCTGLALVLWVQSDASLAQALALASRFLPAGTSLQVQGTTGSLQSGGHIANLLWKADGLAVEVQDLTLRWDWHALLERQLRISALHAAALHVDDQRPTTDAPWDELRLPLQVDLPFVVDRLHWAGPPALQLQGLQGHYRFDGTTHSLDGGRLQFAAGSYAVDGALQARMPGALNLRASGQVQAPLPGTQQSVTLQASARVKGNLYGKDAALDAVLDLVPPGGGATRTLGAMQLHAEAQILPAAIQPVLRASAQWKRLDLASVWPQAPQTSLSGMARVVPEGAGWRAELQVQNALDGTLAQNRVPLQSASANVLYRSGQWQLSQLQAAVAGGAVQAQGGYGGNPAQWQVNGSLKGIDLTRLDPHWVVPRLDGALSARQTGAGLVFDAALSSALQIDGRVQLQAKGMWSAPALQFDSLLLQTPKALVTGQLQMDVNSLATRADLVATLPGAQGKVSGYVSPVAGQGSSEWHVSDAHALAGWLEQMPLIGAQLKGLQVQGVADMTASWRGGWQYLGAGLLVDASLQSRRLEIGADYRLSDVRLEAKGSLQALALQLQGQLQTGPTQLALQSDWLVAQAGSGRWHIQAKQLQAQVKDGLQPVPWKLALEQPLDLDWQSSALARSLDARAGTLRLSGPAPGTAVLQWQPISWSQQGTATDATGKTHWSTRGSLQGLPLAWLEVLGQTRIANLGLRGNLVFGAQWDARGGDGLQLRARLQRSSGDLQLLAADGASALPAGLRETHLEVQIERQDVRASLVWASEAGGSVQADFVTRLAADGSSRWADDAPVQGSLQAKLPRVGAWSLFAPVGWRIHGTLEAHATLAGTRADPAWKGSVAARDMAVRSVVDGIDLSNGVLRLQIDGQHMDIAEFTLQGAGGAGGGSVTATGAVDWLPGAANSANAGVAKRLRMAVDAKAQNFRVTSRPDQRLVVSGNLNARLADARLTVRGALVADQALIVLPDDSTPQLGSDVVVRRSKTPAKAADAPVDDPASHMLRAVAPDMQITLDPGNSFQLQGHGLTTRLAGQLTLKTVAGNPQPRLTGELRTVNGTYKAYGQRLTIEEGKLLFNGPYDNPALDIRAVRPNLQQVVGVQISGTAQLPVVRLYSDPEMAEIEKLSWLVLGRSSANDGAQTAILQQAALALLSGSGKAAPTEQLFNALGLDEVSLGQTAITNLDGTAGTEASVKIGKRLTRDFYVAYERSLAGTLGTLYVFYDLSKRFTLRGESGTTNAIDLIFTMRYD